MTRFITRAVAATAIPALLFAPVSVVSQTVGVTTAVRNSVEIRQTATGAATQASVKQRVTLGNQVDTGGNSSLQVTLLDRSAFTVGPNAKFTINRFVYDPARQRSSVGSSVAKGTFRMLSGKAARGGANSITTPAATIGIRGTMVEGSVGVEAISIAASQPGFAGAGGADPATATLIVLRGPGPNAQGGELPGAIEVTAGGKTIVLTQPGQAVYIPAAGAAPIGPFPLTPAGYAFFDSVLRTAPPSFEDTLAALQSLSLAADAGTGAPSAVADAAGAGTPDSTSGGGEASRGGDAAGGSAEGSGGASSTATFGLLGLAGLIAALVISSGNDGPASP